MFIFTLLDYIGAMVFAMSGVLTAAEKRLDLFGAMFIGVVTAIGGGTTRDLLIGVTPVTWLSTWHYLAVIMTGIVVAIIFRQTLNKLRRTMFLFDTIGIGVFTIIGLEKALMIGVHPAVAILMGVTSAVVGGVIRDTLTNEVPLIFKKEIYATACIAGALVYLALRWLGLEAGINQLLTVGVIITIRLLSIRYNWSMPVLTIDSDQK
ncbi:trimeric intracellular cation channel family protein [Natronoflexus pectinivorans]|uniref:Putative membrane protein YeiH n=1 Tax=Natronoflexus pectinivorans TaxID=682526 RepID=A0A4R2G6C6_9BACT|nr:trimeric intracellular cation channel family protein [Natronoflexus pectinivorans]TCO03011.1 putative membrane protein YeiH [Natronoflexus pectinivorans]